MTDESNQISEREIYEQAGSPVRKKFPWLGFLAVLISFLAIAMAAFSFWQSIKMKNVSSSENTSNIIYERLNNEILELRISQSGQRKSIDNLENFLKDSLGNVSQIALRVEQLDILIKSVPGIEPKLRKDWVKAEALYYLQLANSQALLNRNASLAAKALELADEKLMSVNDPRILAVRALLSDEIISLRARPKIDNEGIVFRLQSLTTQLKDWPFRFSLRKEFRPGAKKIDPKLDGWQRFKATLTSVFSSILSVRKAENIDSLDQFDSTHRLIIVENIKAELQIARLSFLANNEFLFKQSIEQVIKQIERHFILEEENILYALKVLTELRSTSFPEPLPDISRSLIMLMDIGEEK
ncbi:MAG: uroporphyrinogen-III C-methyltransferase [Pseudomonadota bacterium]|nr:uroporphyrinogen-III C-methyltransferase [Pseudomonadota bacterium]